MPIEDTLLKLTWTLAAWEDHEYWQGQDRKTLERVNALIKDSLRHPIEGIGKPGPLEENLSGFWSRRIDDTHRLGYCVDGQALVVIACRYHYQGEPRGQVFQQGERDAGVRIQGHQ